MVPSEHHTRAFHDRGEGCSRAEREHGRRLVVRRIATALAGSGALALSTLAVPGVWRDVAGRPATGPGSFAGPPR
ncbi:hypothetical protein [Kitasatospora acidiphila]|nr:hypothetical protein [Kitasatospora acidiphila]